EVTPELERIVQKSLARDPNQRYQSARELGRDLNSFLFRLGKPVSSFEIATLVKEATEARASEKRHKQKDDKGLSIIGSLIDEAMVEFTSLDTEKNRDGSVVAAQGKGAFGSAPLNLGSFEDVQDWANEDSSSPDERASRLSM